MPTFTTVDATWDTGVTMDAAELKRADTAMFLGDGTNNGVRGGVVRHADTSLAVTVNGSDQVTIQAGAFVIPAATGLGVYRGSLSAALGPSAGTALTARNATNPRIDLIAIQVTGTNATVKTVDGTPAASPSAPALPAQHIELARVSVPAVGGGAVTVDSTFRTYAAAIGGSLYVEQSARLPGSGNQKGQRAIALDTGIEWIWNGTAWVSEIPSWTAVTYSNSWVDFGVPHQVVQYRKVLDCVEIRGLMRSGTINTAAFTLPAGFRPPAELRFPQVANGAFGEMSISAAGVVTPISGSTAYFSVNCRFSVTT